MCHNIFQGGAKKWHQRFFIKRLKMTKVNHVENTSQKLPIMPSIPFSWSILVSTCSIGSFVSDSRLQPDQTLQDLPPSLISMLHAKLSIPNSAAILGEARFAHNIPQL
jgi:hypothetical protein